MSLAAAKYITKYTHKGPDRATVEVQQRNEVSELKDCRYIAASEASWRLFEMPIHHQEPAVMSLQVHLPGQHMVHFNPNECIDVVTTRAQQEKTMLTAFFHLNRIDPTAHDYTYHQLPLRFVWDRAKKQWRQRKRGSTIGRLYFVSPTAGERFYLRTLLTTVKGATSFDDLRTFQGIQHPTYHAACLARGLLENDDEWRQCLQEASLTHLGESLRRLFCLILRLCQPSQPDILWNEFQNELCDDLARRLHQRRNMPCDISEDDVHDFGLFLIDKELRLHGHSLSLFPSMPHPIRNWDDTNDNPYLTEQLSYQPQVEQRLFEEKRSTLNAEQHNAFEQIYNSTSTQDGRSFFLHGPGGTGKTFLYQTLCHRIRANGWIVLCVASSGIASLLLPGGHTAHSTFSIPVENLNEHSHCHVDKNSKQADMLRTVRLIIWDEAVTQHRYVIFGDIPLHHTHEHLLSRHAIEAVNRLLQDVKSTRRFFGGITVVFGGDFEQTLPVVVNGSRPDVIQATIQRSEIWNNMHILHLRHNVRVHTSENSALFAQWLLDIGHGRNPEEKTPSSSICIPESMRCPTEDDLIANVYTSLSHYQPAPPAAYFRDRALLAARNNDIRTLNTTILSRFPGEEHSYHSADTYSIESASAQQNPNIPTEFLNSLNASGLPLADLRLKKGCPVILLRNIDSKRGLCNGTRAVVLHMSNRFIEIQIMSGDHAGESALIPRITLSPSLTNLDFAIKLNRRQFPMQLAFAMTINKAQGQTLTHVGIDLRNPVFTHGQLYVALSRVTSSQHISVLLPPETHTTHTHNVVYSEILLD